MCNTPTYCDLGKAAKDVFNKGYGKYAMVNFYVGSGLVMNSEDLVACFYRSLKVLLCRLGTSSVGKVYKALC